MKILIIFLFLYPSWSLAEELKVDDVSGLNETTVSEIKTPKTVEELQEAVKYANNNNLKISIGGRRHSQGGHIVYANALYIEMTSFNKVLRLDKENKIITVQSGATWADVQEYLNPHNLSVKVQQSSNIFTVGGSLSVNIHGRDPRFGALIDVVKSITLIKPNGKIESISRKENHELFSLVIGGYGLFGIIVSAEIEVVNNSLLEKSTQKIKCEEYPKIVKSEIINNDSIELHYGRPNITSNDLLEECTISNFKRIADIEDELSELDKEKLIGTSKWLMSLSRKFEIGKELRWHLQEKILDNPKKIKIISRNNAMRPAVQFLDYKSDKDTDILQEYFIPIDNFNNFREKLRNIIKDNSVNLLSVTLRLMKADSSSFLPYSKKNTIAFVLYVNHGKSTKDIVYAREWTRKIINAAIEEGGTHYLVYANYATDEQIMKSYPNFDDFLKKKLEHDPEELFMNNFYKRYKKP